jgi:GntR family transcriptional repressor for pyruvate dehydrogenase complex
VLFEQVASQLEGLILTGKIEVGAKLPPEGVLASQFGVSRPVVREALAQLRERGLTETVNGSGTYVRRPDSEGLTDVLLRHLHFGSLAAPQAIQSL